MIQISPTPIPHNQIHPVLVYPLLVHHIQNHHHTIFPPRIQTILILPILIRSMAIYPLIHHLNIIYKQHSFQWSPSIPHIHHTFSQEWAVYQLHLPNHGPIPPLPLVIQVLISMPYPRLQHTVCINHTYKKIDVPSEYGQAVDISPVGNTYLLRLNQMEFDSIISNSISYPISHSII